MILQGTKTKWTKQQQKSVIDPIDYMKITKYLKNVSNFFSNALDRDSNNTERTLKHNIIQIYKL